MTLASLIHSPFPAAIFKARSGLEMRLDFSRYIVLPYGRKFWRGIYFGGLAVLRAILQTSYSMLLYVTLSICRPQSFKMSARNLQTSKEWNENSPDLIYHQLVPASLDVLWFETNSAVFTLLPFRSFYICHHFAMNMIMV